MNPFCDIFNIRMNKRYSPLYKLSSSMKCELRSFPV